MFRYTLPLRRSPGGTPLRRHNLDTQEAADNDPASIIALALRKKFAHKVFQDSPGKIVQRGFSFHLLLSFDVVSECFNIFLSPLLSSCLY